MVNPQARCIALLRTVLLQGPLAGHWCHPTRDESLSNKAPRFDASNWKHQNVVLQRAPFASLGHSRQTQTDRGNMQRPLLIHSADPDAVALASLASTWNPNYSPLAVAAAHTGSTYSVLLPLLSSRSSLRLHDDQRASNYISEGRGFVSHSPHLPAMGY